MRWLADRLRPTLRCSLGFAGVIFAGGVQAAAPLAFDVHTVGAFPELAPRLHDVNVAGEQNLSTYWKNDRQTETAWVTLDLGMETQVESVALAARADRKYDWSMSIGNHTLEGQVDSPAIGTCSTPKTADKTPQTLTDCPLANATGRFLTIRGTNRAAIRLYALELHGQPAAPQTGPPVFLPLQDRSLFFGSTLLIPLSAIDPDQAGPVNFDVVVPLPGDPADIQEEGGEWRLSWTAVNVPPGRYPLGLRAQDADSQQASQTLHVTVLDPSARIQPSAANPRYWSYRGQTQWLLGGSSYDSLFQQSEATVDADVAQILSAGGNYLRNTMNHRSFDVALGAYRHDLLPQAFLQLPDGRFDLSQYNPEFWRRLRTLLNATQAAGIIVQLDLFDAHAWIGDESWEISAWNPDNNVNYAAEQTQLNPDGRWYERNFFEAIPTLNHDPLVYEYQRGYVTKLLSLTGNYDHVLYQIDNETPLPSSVTRHWAHFIQANTSQTVYVADGRRYRPPSYTQPNFQDISHPDNFEPINDPSSFSFLDISQNGGHTGQQQYDNLIWYARQAALVEERPINHAKLYHFNWLTGLNYRFRTAGNDLEAGAKFWRTLFGGAASVRFHRDTPEPIYPGFGISAPARMHIAAARMLEDRFDPAAALPDNSILDARAEDEAYALLGEGGQVAVFFTGVADGEVDVSLVGGSTVPGDDVRLRWLDVAGTEWTPETTVVAAGATNTPMVSLSRPGAGHWIALLGDDPGPRIMAPGTLSGIAGQELEATIVVTDAGGLDVALTQEFPAAAETTLDNLGTDPATWRWRWTPTLADVGMAAVNFTATNTAGQASEHELALDVTASARPLVADPGAQNVVEGQELVLLISATDDSPGALEFAVSGLAGAQLNSVGLTSARLSWLASIDPGSAASREAVLTVTDSGGTTASLTFTVTVTPLEPPEISIAAVGSNPGKSDLLLDRDLTGAPDLTKTSRWTANEGLASAWFTLDLGGHFDVSGLEIAPRANQHHELLITVGDAVVDGEVVDGVAITCTVEVTGSKQPPLAFSLCPLPNSSGQYVQVRSLNREKFRVFGVQLAP